MISIELEQDEVDYLISIVMHDQRSENPSRPDAPGYAARAARKEVLRQKLLAYSPNWEKLEKFLTSGDLDALKKWIFPE